MPRPSARRAAAGGDEGALRFRLPHHPNAPEAVVYMPAGGFRTVAQLDAACARYADEAGHRYLAFWARQPLIDALRAQGLYTRELSADLQSEEDDFFLDRITPPPSERQP